MQLAGSQVANDRPRVAANPPERSADADGVETFRAEEVLVGTKPERRADSGLVVRDRQSEMTLDRFEQVGPVVTREVQVCFEMSLSRQLAARTGVVADEVDNFFERRFDLAHALCSQNLCRGATLPLRAEVVTQLPGFEKYGSLLGVNPPQLDGAHELATPEAAVAP